MSSQRKAEVKPRKTFTIQLDMSGDMANNKEITKQKSTNDSDKTNKEKPTGELLILIV